MAERASSQHSLALRALILTGLVVFGFTLLAHTGLMGSALRSDRSYLSYLILLIYVGASVHWMLLAYRMSGERNRLMRLEHGLSATRPASLDATEGGVRFCDEEWSVGYLAQYLRNLAIKRESADLDGEPTALISALGDVIANRHSTGHFISDVLLRLGLLGTMVGFILMLAPVAEMREFEPALARQLLSEMSGGMAVALYTTVAGLITSTLLKLQYQILDSSAQDFLNRVVLVTDVHLGAATDPASAA